MKKIFFVLTIVLASWSFKGYSQIGISTYSGQVGGEQSLYAKENRGLNVGIGINTSEKRRISAALKLMPERGIEDMRFEMDIFYNFKASDYHQISVGVGLDFLPWWNAVVIPMQLKVFPLQDFKRLSALLEVSAFVADNIGIGIASRLGIRYTFGE